MTIINEPDSRDGPRAVDDETLLRALFDDAAVGVALVDVEGTPVDVNAGLAAMLGYTRDELLSVTMLQATHPDDRALDLPLLGELLDGARSSYSVEKRYLTKDGSVRWGQLSVTLLRRPGAADLVVSMVHDITDRKQAEAALAQRERDLAEAQRVARIGSWHWDVVADEVRWSDELYSLYEADPTAFAGSYEAFIERVHPEDRELVNAAIGRVFANGGTFQFDHRIDLPSGTPRILHGRGEAIMGPDGEVVAMRGTSQDVTEARLTERRLAQAVAELEEANRVRDAIVAMTTHELRTPVTVINGFAAMLASGRPLEPAVAAEAAATIARQAKVLTRLIDDVATLAALDSGGYQVTLTPTLLAPAVAEVAVAVCADIELVIDIPPELVVMVDPGRLEQMVGNYLTNAVKYGRAPLRVEASTVDGYVDLRVRDSGSGVPDDFVPQLFTRFARAGGATRGTGLGLAIVKELAVAHGGDAWYESEPSSTFVVRLRTVA